MFFFHLLVINEKKTFVNRLSNKTEFCLLCFIIFRIRIKIILQIPILNVSLLILGAYVFTFSKYPTYELHFLSCFHIKTNRYRTTEVALKNGHIKPYRLISNYLIKSICWTDILINNFALIRLGHINHWQWTQLY